MQDDNPFANSIDKVTVMRDEIHIAWIMSKTIVRSLNIMMPKRLASALANRHSSAIRQGLIRGLLTKPSLNPSLANICQFPLNCDNIHLKMIVC